MLFNTTNFFPIPWRPLGSATSPGPRAIHSAGGELLLYGVGAKFIALLLTLTVIDHTARWIEKLPPGPNGRPG
jgi:hypothetical protein